MKERYSLLAGLASMLCAASAQAAEKNACGQIVSATMQTQRLADIHEINNVASAHEYYHSAWLHKDEIENAWSKREDISWTNNTDRYANRKSFWRFYVDNLKTFPSKGTLAYHMLTTPIIEVAGDGKTAKAIYMSFGNVAGPGMNGGPAQAQWTEEKYGMDFIKEDGHWKIWHLRTFVEYYFNVGGMPTNPNDNMAAMETKAMKDGKTVNLAELGGDHKDGNGPLKATVQQEAGASFAMAQPDEKKIFYEGYSLDRDPPYTPPIPKAYCTFSQIKPY